MTEEIPKIEESAPEVYAFIDAQNMHMATCEQGWEVGFKELHTYLTEKHGVTKAYMFFGFLEENQAMYDKIEGSGFDVIFQDVTRQPDGTIKGNVDVNLTIYAVCDMRHYSKAVLITADGDFQPLVLLLKRFAKEVLVISPAPKQFTSKLLRQASAGSFVYLDNIRKKVSRAKKMSNTPKD